MCTCTAPALRTQSTSHSTARGEEAQPCFKVWSEQRKHPRRYGRMKNVQQQDLLLFLTLWHFSVPDPSSQELKGTSELHSEGENFGKKYTQRVSFMY